MILFCRFVRVLSGTVLSAFMGLFCLGLFCLGIFCVFGTVLSGNVMSGTVLSVHHVFKKRTVSQHRVSEFFIDFSTV